MSVPDVNLNRLYARSSTVTSLQGIPPAVTGQGFPKALFQAGLHANLNLSLGSVTPLENPRTLSATQLDRVRNASPDTPSYSNDRHLSKTRTFTNTDPDPTNASKPSPIRDRQEILDPRSQRTANKTDSIGESTQPDVTDQPDETEISSADFARQGADPADNTTPHTDDSDPIQSYVDSDNKKITDLDQANLEPVEDVDLNQLTLLEVQVAPLPTGASVATTPVAKPTLPQASVQSHGPVVETTTTHNDGQAENLVDMQDPSSTPDLAKQTDNVVSEMPELVGQPDVQTSLTSDARNRSAVVDSFHHHSSTDGPKPTTNTPDQADDSNPLDASGSTSQEDQGGQNTNLDSQSNAQHDGLESDKNTNLRSADRATGPGLTSEPAVMNLSNPRYAEGQSTLQTISPTSASNFTTNASAGVKADSSLTTPNNAMGDDANVSRVMRGLRGVLNQNGGSVNVRLTPPELGVVRVQMKINQGAVTVQLQAEHESARSLLQHQLSQLRTALEAHGLTVEKLEVQSLSQTQQSNLGNDANQPHGGNDGSRTTDQSAADGRSRGRFDQSEPSGDEPGSDRDGRDGKPYSASFDEALNLVA